MTFATFAEQQADKARDLPEFHGFSLPGFRGDLVEWLGLIGRVEGIFSTYTKHDISHIDSMLKMLDWLIPDQTKEQMTPADWLLAVLSIYLHDLGMFVTQGEFAHHRENDAFLRWFNGLRETKEGQDYLARPYRMTKAERERFFFQEFIRMGHAQRIREWVTGRHTTIWGDKVLTIANAIGQLLSALPVRFREYLGLICESHHLDDQYRSAHKLPTALVLFWFPDQKELRASF
jgi:molecular chaperone HtpG